MGPGPPRDERGGRTQAAEAGSRGGCADVGRGVGQRGRDDRLAETDAAQRLSGVAEKVGGRAHVLLALSEQEDEQGLREVVRKRGSVRLRRDDTADGEAVGPCLRLSRQFLEKLFGKASGVG